jgi:hypothetical protein
MSAMEEKEAHSRSSADTNNVDLENGEARPEAGEEEVVAQKVRVHLSTHRGYL